MTEKKKQKQKQRERSINGKTEYDELLPREKYSMNKYRHVKC